MVMRRLFVPGRNGTFQHALITAEVGVSDNDWVRRSIPSKLTQKKHSLKHDLCGQKAVSSNGGDQAR